MFTVVMSGSTVAFVLRLNARSLAILFPVGRRGVAVDCDYVWVSVGVGGPLGFYV